jgi:hypothetical protein
MCSAMSWNESESLAARRKILKAAQDMLVGKLSYIEGATLKNNEISY